MFASDPLGLLGALISLNFSCPVCHFGRFLAPEHFATVTLPPVLVAARDLQTTLVDVPSNLAHVVLQRPFKTLTGFATSDDSSRFQRRSSV